MAQSTDSVTTQLGVAYANHDGVELQGDLYLPKGKSGVPALVAVHGGGWVQGARNAFQHWGPYLASRGIAMFTISYRLATKGKTFPQAVQDVLAGVQFVRGKAGEFGIDPQRIGLMGASAGGTSGVARRAQLVDGQIRQRLSAGPVRIGRRRREGADRGLRRL